MSKYDLYDNSTIGQGILAWFLFNLGLIPLIIYALYLKVQGNVYGKWGILGKRATLTFATLSLIEIVVAVIIILIGVNSR